MSSRLDLDLGTDERFAYEVLDDDDATVAVDVSTWSLSFMIKRSAHDADADALVTKTSGAGITVEGTYASAASANTQRIVVTVNDTDTDAIDAGHAVRELKRMDAGSEQVLDRGQIRLMRAVHHA